MTRADYYLLDVFTDRPFTGNPLAVFLESDALAPHHAGNRPVAPPLWVAT